MAASLAECDAMLQAEKENGVVLGQVAQNRFTNPYWKLKKVLDNGLPEKTVSMLTNAKLSAPWNPKAEVSMGNGFPADGGNKVLLKELENAYQAIPDLKYTGHTGEIDDVLSALEKGTRPLITGVDGKRTVEMITAIYKAGFTDQFVRLPMLSEDEYYCGDGIQKNAIHSYKKGKALDCLSAEEIKVEAVQ